MSCPTVNASAPERSIISRMPGVLAASAIGTPNIAVVARVVQLLISFIHLAERISDEITAVPECDRIFWISCSRPADAASMLPTENHERSGGD